MIVVTGGAGFIGSAIVWRLNQRGEKNIVVVETIDKSSKWRNLAPLRYADCIEKIKFVEMLEAGKFGNTIEAIIHMGACSSTMETDEEYLTANNYEYTARIAQWCGEHRKSRFIYASSAATYGNGEHGYSDNEDELHKLQPLNLYAVSKHRFDLLAKSKGWFSLMTGLKYFNVFGPNEYHKEEMRSVIHKKYPDIRDKGTMTLFKSYRSDVKDGEQKRDFIYVKDAVDITLYFLDNPDKNGLYNVGTGIAGSWNDVASAMFKAVGKESAVEYIPMPDILKDKYQYYTCADMNKLRDAGCEYTCMSLDSAIKDYIGNYLVKNVFLGMEQDREAEGSNGLYVM